MTWFANLLDQYLAERRRHGGDPASSGLVLRPFVLFADAEGDEWITTDLFLRWKDRFGAAGPHTWAIRLSVVRGFATWLQGIDPRTEVPPAGLIPNRQRRRRPHIYTDDEIVRIVVEAARLPSARGLRGATYATLFGLLAVTGLRIGEAVGLDDADVDPDATLRMSGMPRTEGAVSFRSRRALPSAFAPTAPRESGSPERCRRRPSSLARTNGG